jgi:hypothetical protein
MLERLQVDDVRELSSIGDSFVNLIYSLALSYAQGKPVSRRASNYVLGEALTRAGMRGLAGHRIDRHGLADYAEGLLFQGWMEGRITIEECVYTLRDKLLNFESEKEASIEGFAELLKRIKG